jgi:hypothetical protein
MPLAELSPALLLALQTGIYYEQWEKNCYEHSILKWLLLPTLHITSETNG